MEKFGSVKERERVFWGGGGRFGERTKQKEF